MSKNILKEENTVSDEFDRSKYVVFNIPKKSSDLMSETSPLHQFDRSKYVVMNMPVKRDNITGKLVRNDNK